MFAKTYTIESELPVTQTFLSHEWVLKYGARAHKHGQRSRWQLTLLRWRIQAIPNILQCFYPHDLKPYCKGVKCTWLHFRDEESADRPNQILPIFCQILCTCTKPPILPCLLKYVLCLSARCFVELVCAEVQDMFVYSLPPCPRDKWQDSLPKKVKQLMHLERGRGSPDSETAYYVLACANLWNVS